MWVCEGGIGLWGHPPVEMRGVLALGAACSQTTRKSERWDSVSLGVVSSPLCELWCDDPVCKQRELHGEGKSPFSFSSSDVLVVATEPSQHKSVTARTKQCLLPPCSKCHSEAERQTYKFSLCELYVKCQKKQLQAEHRQLGDATDTSL